MHTWLQEFLMESKFEDVIQKFEDVTHCSSYSLCIHTHILAVCARGRVCVLAHYDKHNTNSRQKGQMHLIKQ